MVTKQPFTVALCQMTSGANLDDNLQMVGELLANASEGGAKLACLPELWPCLSGDHTKKLAIAEKRGDGKCQKFMSKAAVDNNMFILGGSIPIIGNSDKIYNTSILYGSDGRVLASYDKIHLFKFEASDRSYNETASCLAGSKVVWCDTELGRIGLSICYDIRFPELFRSMTIPDLIITPSAFTVQTGQAHWELLIRARAVENLCYVIAPAQCGTHDLGLKTWGHSLVIDPWGKVIADGANDIGVTFTTIDPKVTEEARRCLPALTNRQI